jgi:hypothetical protein
MTNIQELKKKRKKGRDLLRYENFVYTNDKNFEHGISRGHVEKEPVKVL